jgi:hypothetical protein
MDRKVKEVFFELLRIGLWNKKSETNFPKLSIEQWNKI